MNRQTLLVLSLMVLSPLVLATQGAANAAAQDGLVSVQSRTLDEVYMRPSVNWAGYRKILIDPAQVTLKSNWRRDQNATRDVSRWISVTDAEELVAAAAASMNKMVADTFAAKGYEIVTAPGPGVMRLTPTVTDLDVYEPDVTFSRPQALFTKDEAGTATLRLEARDADTGALLGAVVDRGTASQVARFNRTNKITNLFWFDGMFSRWTANCIAAMEAAPAQ
jgi:Protein of unknown function (DUF3313)